ncbi:CRE-FAT-3 protein [Meloidogyne graminicola]|uniref:CRE-FAT-3 protein n=1 Tax=Meloidogyne graminicola TaxID=189291 RepID=A0A8T0A668_9BILA|nr:CRE-FAT-3 protein [Meloidogyne graminicola]
MDENKEKLIMKINNRWIYLTEEFIKSHPGGPVITQYRNADATHIFHAFHEGSKKAYKQLELLKEVNKPLNSFNQIQRDNENEIIDNDDFVVINYNIPLEKEKKIVIEFEKLRQFILKLNLILKLILIRFNDLLSLFFGNFAQGFSRDWWKDKHNLHHATTNIISRDGDIDLSPLLALVPNDLYKQKTLISNLIIRLIIPYQYFYFTLMYPLLRISWLIQSILHSFTSINIYFPLTLFLHWFWVFFQLWLLPSNFIRIIYFLISQLGAGLFIALVVSYNHNSVSKFPENSGLLNNFAALHILTTRNMKSSLFVDWFWGGLNYQIEHHLFPTMPRPNLKKCSLLVKQFCLDTELNYLEDDFLTGYFASLKLLYKISKRAINLNSSK